MHVSAPSPRAQTIKQAKAAYKARGRPSISEKEKKQLERAVELDRRAWRTREAEKRKAEAAKKRTEKENKEAEERRKAHIGSQRRYDRFGFRGSQMHLGAFLGKKREVRSEQQKENVGQEDGLDGQDEFGDGELCDVTLLDALEGVQDVQTSLATKASTKPVLQSLTDRSHPKPISGTPTHKPEPPPPPETDMDSFWDDLESSTQVARELSTESPPNQKLNEKSLSVSFSSGDFDLTAQELEELEQSIYLPKKADLERTLMPPPALPVKRLEATAAADIGFTMSDIEQYIDDDLQLTQADPG